MNELLDYVSSGAVSGELSERLDAEVARVLDNKKWRLEYMIQQVREQLSFERGEASGFEKGEVIGLANLDAEVARVLDNKKWRLEYMIQQVREQLSFERGEASGFEKGEVIGLAKGEQIGLEKGEQIGIAKGEQIGLEKGEQIGLARGEQIGLEKGAARAQERLARLASALHSAGRSEDFIAAMGDPASLEMLYAEYGIS